MRRQLQTTLALLFTALLIAPAAWGQDPGGPYTVDDNTIVLMHFDGTAANESDSTADGFLSAPVASGTPNGTQASFFESDVPRSGEGFSQSLHLDNKFTGGTNCNGTGNCEFVTIPDDDNLDLTSDFTIEVWARTTPYGPNNAPHFFYKADGAGSANRNGFFLNTFLGANLPQDARAGYSLQGSTFQNATTPANTVTPGDWYHYSFIRDTGAGEIYIIVRDSDLNVVGVGEDQLGGMPEITGDSLYIGVKPYNGGNHTEGNMDEVRISSVVRPNVLAAAPNITAVRPGDNSTLYTTPNQSFTVEADVSVVGPDTATVNVTLNYRLGAQGMFQTVAMNNTGGNTYTSDIPGQPDSTSVQYYVSAETSDGTRLLDPSGAENDGFLDYYGIGFSNGPADGIVMDLDFEEGTNGGMVSSVNDKSGYDHEFEIFGDPTYGAGIEGSTALDLDGTDDHIAVGAIAPFLASEEFTLDFWFNSRGNEAGDTYVVKQGGNGVTAKLFHDNYKVFYFGGTNSMRGASWESGGGLNGGVLDADLIPTTGTWYHAIYTMSADTAFVQFRNTSGEVVGEAGYSRADLPATATRGPFFVGKSREPGNSAVNGRIDDVKLYNYVALKAGQTTVAMGETGTVFENTSDIMARVNFTTGAGTGGDLSVSRYAAPPSNTGITGTATAPNGDPVTPNRISNVQHWIVEAKNGLSGYTAETCFSTENEVGIVKRDSLVLVKREDAESQWVAQNSTLEDVDGDGDNEYLCAAGQTQFSEFAVAGQDPRNALPVELTSFTGTADGDGAALLTWRTASETDNARFEVQQQTDGSWTQIGRRQGAGTTSEPHRYRFRTGALDPGTHSFRLRQVDRGGTPSFSEPVTVELGMAERAVLKPVYPNPARERATVRFGVRESAPVTLTLYDALGRKVSTVYEGTPEAEAMQTVTLDGGGLPSGLYLLRLRGNGFSETKTLTVAR